MAAAGIPGLDAALSQQVSRVGIEGTLKPPGEGLYDKMNDRRPRGYHRDAEPPDDDSSMPVRAVETSSGLS